MMLLGHHASHGNHLGGHDTSPNGMRNAKTSATGSSGFATAFLCSTTVGRATSDQTGRTPCAPVENRFLEIDVVVRIVVEIEKDRR